MPRFHKRHYETIAEVFSSMRGAQLPLFEVTALNTVLCRLADQFATDNPHFDRQRFLDASALLPSRR